MGKSVKETHNLDGSVRTETTYTYKDALGTKHSTTYVTKQTAEERTRQEQQQTESQSRIVKGVLIGFAVLVVGGGLLTSLLATL